MKIKISYRILAVLTILFSLSNYFAMAQANFEWVRHVNGTNEEDGWSITHDSQGNVFTAGTFYDTINVSPGAGNQLLIPVAYGGGFVIKTDAAGNLVWAKAFQDISVTGSAGVRIQSMATDVQGNLFISGIAFDSADLNPGGQVLLTTSDYNGFLCKLNAAGNLVWAKVFPCYTNGYISNFIMAYRQKSFYITGSFRDSIDLDPGTGSADFYASTYDDVFILKLDSAGDLEWAKKIGGNSYDQAYSIAADNNGDVYVGGTFEGTCDFHPGNQTVNLNSSGEVDGYVLKLNSNGNFQFVKKLGGVSNDYVTGVDVDNDGNIYTTGSFEDSADFQPGAGTYMLTALDSYDAFICKLDTGGAMIWARQIAAIDFNESKGIELDNAGNVYTIGSFYSHIDFDVSPALDTLSANPNGSAAYLHALDNNGNYLWAKPVFSDDNNVEFVSLSVKGSSFYITGDFSNTVDFDPGNGMQNLTGVDDDVFILKWSNCTNSASTFTTSACHSYTWVDGNTYTNSTNSPTYTYTAQGGCDSIVTLDLTINTVDVSVTDNSPVLNANASNATYRWIDCGTTTPVANQTAQSFTATQNGSYAVEVTQNGCVDTSVCVQVTGVSIEEAAGDLVSIYPNPSNGNFVISISNDQKFSAVRLFDTTGRIILQNSIANNTLVLSEVEAGTYVVELRNDKVVARKQIVVQ